MSIANRCVDGARERSRNYFVGSFPLIASKSLVSLKLMHNDFIGPIRPLNGFPSITLFDVSNNQFVGEFSQLSTSPFLVSLNVRNNLLTGPIAFTSLPNLETADLSSNRFDEEIHLSTIGEHYTHYALQTVNLLHNPYIPVFPNLETLDTGLTRANASFPAQTVTGAVCYQLNFNNRTTRSFQFDEGLFSYSQCDCDVRHFGAPQNRCYECPQEVRGIASCSANALKTRPDWFTMVHKTPNHTSLLQLETCVFRPAQQVGVLTTNCLGLNVTTRMLQNASLSEEEMLARQCRNGSAGRLCSRCICNPYQPGGDCWFEKGTTCHHCTRTFTKTQSIVTGIAAVVLVVLFLTIIMFVVLRHKRTQSNLPWAQLPFFKRLFHRIMLLTSLGNVTILINFLQLLAELTHWDAYALRGFLALLNGSGEGFGLRCVFPLLADPLIALLVRVTLPLFIIILLAISIWLAAFLSHYWSIYQRHKYAVSHNMHDVLSDSEWEHLLPHPSDEHYVPYPALALFTSLSITAVKFLYFGTAIAAHEYIFASSQPYTGVKYVQNQPWMKFSDAKTLIGASIPVILIYDLLIPVSFVYLCWRVRAIYHEHHVHIYLGSLLETYSDSCFWWELLKTLKKLVLALILQGISPSSAFQTSLLLTVIAGSMVVQVTMSPWKRKIENFSDVISAVLLIGSMQSSRSAHLSDSAGSVYYILTLDCIFVLGNVAVILYLTITAETDYEHIHTPAYIIEHSDAEHRSHLHSDLQSDAEGTSDEGNVRMKQNVFFGSSNDLLINDSEELGH